MKLDGWFASLAHRASTRALKKLENDENFQFLKQHKLFQDLGPIAFHFLYGRLNERRYRHDEQVFKEGNPGICLFIVKQGRIEIYGQDEEDRETTVYTQVGPGELFGELSLISTPYRNSSARVVDHGAVLLTLTAYDLEELCLLFPAEGVKLIRALNRTLVDHLVEVDRRLRDARREIRTLKERLEAHE